MSSTHSELQALRLDNVDYRHAPGLERTLLNASANFKAGSIVAVVGPNGAGKSTLLRLLSGLLEPSAGIVLTVDADGTEAAYPADARLRAQLVHFVPADNVPIFDFSVEQVVAMGRYPHRGRSGNLTAEDRDRVHSAIERTGILELANRSVLTLSSGELRRTWIARAIVSDARFLLLDEPTANLDLAHALALTEQCRQLAAAGHGIVVAIHDLETAYQLADQVMLLETGKPPLFGSPAEILNTQQIEQTFGVRYERVPEAERAFANRRLVLTDQEAAPESSSDGSCTD